MAGQDAIPPRTVARDLASARRSDELYLDRQGRVMSNRRRLTRRVVLFTVDGAAVGLALAGEIWLGLPWPLWLVTLAAPLGWVIWQFGRLPELNRLSRLVAAGRDAEARAPLEALLSKPLLTPLVRGMAEQNLGVVCGRRGDHVAALEHHRRAVRALARVGRRARAHRGIAEHAVVTSLVSLDRVEEARRALAALPPPVGEVLVLLRWTAELYVCLGEGRHTLAADELHARTRSALGMTLGATLLTLLAWAHHENADLDMAWHLVREAEDRLGGRSLAGMPKLEAWRVAHLAEALATAPAG